MSDFDENDIVTPKPSSDFDEADVVGSNDYKEVAPDIEAAHVDEVSEFAPQEAVKTIGGTVIGAGLGKAGGNFVGKKIIDPFAEDLAYRAAGGQAGTKAGKALNTAAVLDKVNLPEESILDRIKKLAGSEDARVFDNGVNPRNVGREVLDSKLLGPGGFGFNEGNFDRANKNLLEKSKPTNAILNSIENQTIDKQDILKKAKELAGYDDLNMAAEQNRKLKKVLDAEEPFHVGQSTPMDAERVKRDIHLSVDHTDVDKNAKNARDIYLGQANKDAVENAVEGALGPERLAEFRRLKAASGNAGIAKDMLQEVFEKGQKSGGGVDGIIKPAVELLKRKFPGIAATGLNQVSKVAKSALAPVAGGFLGGLTGLMAADDQTDSTDFIPVLDQATAAGSSMDDKELKTELKALQNYDQSPAKRDAEKAKNRNLNIFNELQQPKIQALQNQNSNMEQDLAKADPSFQQGFAYKQGQNLIAKNKAEIDRMSKSSPIVENGKALKQSTPEQLMELSQSFNNIKGANAFVAPLENAAQASSEEEKQARLFGLYQQPAFRQLLNKGKKVE